ncbi:MAG: LacI family transcriptional regulator, partial [Okeania sp. SIO3B3]|nr:LacI family transcriptional regulator [Okeania sp. SIO3B3]
MQPVAALAEDVMSRNNVRTIADIAHLAGVSKSTVSRALSDSSLISDETKKRIKKIAAEHNYQIHQAARNLSLQRSSTLGFVLLKSIENYANDPFVMDMVGHISNTLVDYQYDLLVAQLNINQPEQLTSYLTSKRVDGLIVVTNDDYRNVLDHLAQQKAPFIAWNAPRPGQTYSSVNCDNVAGAKLATQHLLDLNCQRVAYVGGNTGCLEVGLRYQGYCDALEAAG